MQTLVYLYGHVPADAPAPAAELTGVGDAPVELYACGDVAAVVARVPAEEFSAEAVEARLDDLDWVGGQGVRHERVVAWFVDATTIVPARLFTLFSGDDALEKDCAERAAWITSQVERLSGLREWDLKVSYDEQRLLQHVGRLSTEVARLDEEIEGAAPGRRYLLERQRADRAKAVMREAARGAAVTVLDDLAGVATDTRQVPVPSAAAAAAPVVLSAAVLLAQDQEMAAGARMQAARDRFEPIGLSVAFTGPWAAYRFMDAS